MSFSDLFADNVLVKWLRGDTGRHDLTVSMVGVKLGERLVQLGGRDGHLLAALGAKTGLTGQVVGVETSGADATMVQQAAERAGVLADAVAAPGWRTDLAPESFDITVVPSTTAAGGSGAAGGTDAASGARADLEARVGEAFRLLRTGGRCALVQRAGSGSASPDAIVTLLQQHGFRAARVLAERDGLVFYEALKK